MFLQVSLPKSLYKYQSISKQSLENLKNAQIYFNAPKKFNDPYDCSLILKSLDLSEDNLNEIRIHINKNFEIKNLTENINKISDVIQCEILKYQEEILNNRGCSCFSEVNNSILMWSHYSDNHKGMCLEFDTSYELFSKAMKVEYGKEFPSVNPLIYFKNDNIDKFKFFKPILSKYKDWSYEKEWRIFHKESNKLFGYELDSLKAVYFGCNVQFVDIELVSLILQSQNQNVKFYKAKKSEENYTLNFEEFEYVPYNKISK